MKMPRELLAFGFAFGVGIGYRAITGGTANDLDMFVASLATLYAAWIAGWLKV